MTDAKKDNLPDVKVERDGNDIPWLMVDGVWCCRLGPMSAAGIEALRADAELWRRYGVADDVLDELGRLRVANRPVVLPERTHQQGMLRRRGLDEDGLTLRDATERAVGYNLALDDLLALNPHLADANTDPLPPGVERISDGTTWLRVDGWFDGCPEGWDWQCAVAWERADDDELPEPIMVQVRPIVDADESDAAEVNDTQDAAPEVGGEAVVAQGTDPAFVAETLAQWPQTDDDCGRCAGSGWEPRPEGMPNVIGGVTCYGCFGTGKKPAPLVAFLQSRVDDLTQLLEVARLLREEAEIELAACRRDAAPDPDAPHPHAVPVDPTERDMPDGFTEFVPTWRMMGEDVRTLGDEWEVSPGVTGANSWRPPINPNPSAVYLVRRAAEPQPEGDEMVTVPAGALREVVALAESTVIFGNSAVATCRAALTEGGEA